MLDAELLDTLAGDTDPVMLIAKYTSVPLCVPQLHCRTRAHHLHIFCQGRCSWCILHPEPGRCTSSKGCAEESGHM